jgi:hypothetical protein
MGELTACKYSNPILTVSFLRCEFKLVIALKANLFPSSWYKTLINLTAILRLAHLCDTANPLHPYPTKSWFLRSIFTIASHN